jgi:hypothetical protein
LTREPHTSSLCAAHPLYAALLANLFVINVILQFSWSPKRSLPLPSPLNMKFCSIQLVVAAILLMVSPSTAQYTQACHDKCVATSKASVSGCVVKGDRVPAGKTTCSTYTQQCFEKKCGSKSVSVNDKCGISCLQETPKLHPDCVKEGDLLPPPGKKKCAQVMSECMKNTCNVSRTLRGEA